MRNSRWLIAALLSLALLGVCGLMLLVMWGSIGALQTSGVRFSMFHFDNYSAQADEEQRFTASPPARLIVENSIGDIRVTAGTGSEIAVTAHKTAWGSTQAEADAALAALKVNITQDGNAVTVRFEQISEVLIVGQRRDDSVDFTITVPMTTTVTAQTNFGEVTVTGTHGDVDLQTNYGALRASDLKGGAVKLQSDFGSVTLENSTASSVEARTSSGGIALARVEAEADVTLNSDFGMLEFDHGRAGSLAAQTNNGKVDLRSIAVSGAVTAKSQFGEVALTGVTAESYDLSSNNGDVSVGGASGSVKAHTEFGSVEVTNAEAADLDLQSNNGSIEFSGSLGPGPHTLKTEFGSIRLTVPKTAALDFDLKTEFGKIRSDLPITISGSPDEKHWQGTINGGGASLTAETNNGDITIDILK